MSNAYQCDRCGNLVPGSRFGHLNLDSSAKYSFGGDVCKECTLSLNEWWGDNND